MKSISVLLFLILSIKTKAQKQQNEELLLNDNVEIEWHSNGKIIKTITENDSIPIHLFPQILIDSSFFNEFNYEKLVNPTTGFNNLYILFQLKKRIINSEQNSYKIFPNPVSQSFSISNGSQFNLEKLSIKVVDIYGKIILQGMFQPNTVIQFNCSKSGIYFVQIEEKKEAKLIVLPFLKM